MTKYSADRERYVRKVQDEINGFTTQLLSDNEGLRLTAARLNAENQKLHDELLLIQEERAAWEARERQLRTQLLEIETRQGEAARERIRMERRNAELTHLYVACHRLHEGPDRVELFQALEEILGSIVGCEEFGIYAVDAEAAVLRLEKSVGVDEPWTELPLGTGRIGTAATEGAIWIAPGGTPGTEDGITACVPLLYRGRAIGVIALFGLLEHKPQLGEFEREVFEILVHQAGAALYCSGCGDRSSAPATGEA